ncbi:Protein-methionine-sulfoxide reductase catalytic subunit MsrP [archaeon HR01]|nr:Protein-methionine-sulfoxide reductase catalytic subunit MsrP [archaeon HR01]
MKEGLPPGQVWARNWVIYAALGIPRIDPETWRLKVSGLVEKPAEYTYYQLEDMATVRYVRHFHCVTKWSIKDVEWTGVPLKDLISNSLVKDEARWVMFHCADGYTAPIPLEDAIHPDAILALKIGGEPLKAEQGFPARPFIPHLYGWKSAKWVTEIELLPTYVDGYWEMYGYHERGEVWGEERFKGMVGKHSRRTSYGILPKV